MNFMNALRNKLRTSTGMFCKGASSHVPLKKNWTYEKDIREEDEKIIDGMIQSLYRSNRSFVTTKVQGMQLNPVYISKALDSSIDQSHDFMTGNSLVILFSFMAAASSMEVYGGIKLDMASILLMTSVLYHLLLLRPECKSLENAVLYLESYGLYKLYKSKL